MPGLSQKAKAGKARRNVSPKAKRWKMVLMVVWQRLIRAQGLSQRECFHRGMTGHWKQNCPDFLSKKKTVCLIESLVSEVIFATSTSESWCVDSDATNNICNSLQGF